MASRGAVCWHKLLGRISGLILWVIFMFYLFEPRARVIRDERELRELLMRYGKHAKSVLRARADDAKLMARERKHWRRLARKMPRFQEREASENNGMAQHNTR